MQVCTPEPQFPHPQSGDSNAHFVGMAGGPQTHGAVHGVGAGHVMWGGGGGRRLFSACVSLTPEIRAKQISGLFVKAKKCLLSEEFRFGRQAQVLGQNLIPSGMSRPSIQASFLGSVTTQSFVPSTWTFPGQAFPDSLAQLGCLSPFGRLCLALNRCFFSLFLGRLNGSLPPAVPEADLSVKL